MLPSIFVVARGSALSPERWAGPLGLCIVTAALLITASGCQHSNAIPLDGGAVLPIGNDRPGHRQRREVAAPAWPIGSWTILPLSQGPIATSHGGQAVLATGVESYWVPRDSDVNEADGAVRAALQGRVGWSGYGRAIDAYDRQYVGIVVLGAKLLYVAGFHLSLVDDAAMRLLHYTGEPFDWRREALEVGDGGELVFHAVYDPASTKLVAFRFNNQP